MGGFSLVELMLSLSLGLALSSVMLQGLIAEGHNAGRFSRLVRERAMQRRALELIGADLRAATTVSALPVQIQPTCALSGRTPLLHLTTASGAITYSVGSPPSGIWRGHVLMRCGPAFALDGSLNWKSAPQNRVVLDALPIGTPPEEICAALQSSQAVGVCLNATTGLLGVRLAQRFDGTHPMAIQTQKSFALEDMPPIPS